MAWLSNSKSRSHVVVGILIVYSLCSSFSNSFLQELSGSPCVLWTPVDSAWNSNVRALALALFASSATLQPGWRKLAWLSHHAALIYIFFFYWFIYLFIYLFIFMCNYTIYIYVYIDIHLCTYMYVCVCICYVMLCYVILCCIVLCYIIVYYIILHQKICYIILYYIISYYIMLY